MGSDADDFLPHWTAEQRRAMRKRLMKHVRAPKHPSTGTAGSAHSLTPSTGKPNVEAVAEFKADMKKRRAQPRTINTDLGQNPPAHLVKGYLKQQRALQRPEEKPPEPKPDGEPDYPWLKPGWKW